MRTRRRIMLVLVLAGFAAMGCSRSGETTLKAESTAAPMKPATRPAESLPVKRIADDESIATATAIVASPLSYADGEAAYRARKYSDATAIFERYTAEHPEHAWGHFMLGLSAWKGNDLPKAEKALEAALAIEPLHVKSLLNLSRVLIEQKRFDEALERLTRAEQVEPTSPELHRLLGRTLYAQRKTEAAEDAYRRALELDERDVWSMNNLGLLLLEQQRADEAVPLLVKAVELRKDVPAFHNNLGIALEHTGRLEDAATAYAGALAADSHYDRAKQNLARVEAVIGARD